MSYNLEFSHRFQKELRKLDRYQATLITRWLYQNIDGIENPKSLGKGLTANRSGTWRYRVGNYRVIVEIQETKMIVLELQVGHRKNIYNRD